MLKNAVWLYCSEESCPTWQVMILANKMKWAALGILNKLYELNWGGKKKLSHIFVKIFDAQIQAIAKYGAEIWGLEKNVSTEEKKKTASICCEKVFGGLAG